MWPITNVYSFSKPLLGTNSVPGPVPGTGDAKTNRAPTPAPRGLVREGRVHVNGGFDPVGCVMGWAEA